MSGGPGIKKMYPQCIEIHLGYFNCKALVNENVSAKNVTVGTLHWFSIIISLYMYVIIPELYCN